MSELFSCCVQHNTFYKFFKLYIKPVLLEDILILHLKLLRPKNLVLSFHNYFFSLFSNDLDGKCQELI